MDQWEPGGSTSMSSFLPCMNCPEKQSVSFSEDSPSKMELSPTSNQVVANLVTWLILAHWFPHLPCLTPLLLQSGSLELHPLRKIVPQKPFLRLCFLKTQAETIWNFLAPRYIQRAVLLLAPVGGGAKGEEES